MEKKLNLHDLFGFLFPGAVLCAVVYVFLVRIGKVPSGQLDWSATLAMLPVAYVVGVLVHQFSSERMHEENVALTIMQDHDHTFTPAFKQHVREAFAELFKLPSEGDRKTLQTMFDACYDYVLQKGKGIYVENNYGIYSLCRSMIPISAIAGALALWLVARKPALAGAEYFLLVIIVAGTSFSIGIFWRAKNKFIKRVAVDVGGTTSRVPSHRWAREVRTEGDHGPRCTRGSASRRSVRMTKARDLKPLQDTSSYLRT